MRLLDLCCGAGGAAVGYARAGFDVVGVDDKPQRQYPYEFHRSDAITFLAEHGHEFDAIHASFPCQAYTAGAKRAGTSHLHPDLIGVGRQGLLATGKPYVIENVELARRHLQDPVMLCGQMFGLGVFRHRLFEMPWYRGEPITHQRHDGRVGDGKYVTVTGHCGGSSTRDGAAIGSLAQWRTAMGIDWMSSRRLAQAIPPAYSHWVGTALSAHLHLKAPA